MAYALVTGASKGIGRALAFELAQKGYNLLLVARSGGDLKNLADSLSHKFSVNVNYLPLDLSEPGAADSVINWINTNSFDLSVLINNAGYGLWGNFYEIPLSQQNNMMQLNMTFITNLCHGLIPVLKKNKPAYIMNVASTTAYQAIPSLSVYSATKSYVVSFTRGLHHELKGSGISVSCLSPGTTNTNFIERSGMSHMEKASEKVAMTPEQVAKIALRGMFKGKAEIIPGFINSFSVALINILPKKLVEKAAQNLYKKK